jgi:amino acid transporter
MPKSYSLHSLPSHHEYPEEFSSPSRLTSNSQSYYNISTNHSSAEPWYRVDRDRHPSLSQRFVDSFKRDPKRRTINPSIYSTDHHGALDPHMAVIATANTALARKLKGRHLQMIAIGGSVG